MLKEGAFYLFTLRLLPAVPFFVINFVMGLTSLRTVTFFWVSQLGMLPATLVYVNAGSELGKIQSIDDILSPQLIISFVLLGIFPLLVKKILTARGCGVPINIPIFGSDLKIFKIYPAVLFSLAWGLDFYTLRNHTESRKKIPTKKKFSKVRKVSWKNIFKKKCPKNRGKSRKY